MLNWVKNLAALAGDLAGDERGSLPEMTWVIGAALVVAAVIVVALVFAPQTAQDFWTAATNYIRSQFGF
ncbi:MAG: hypothetical protein IMW96_10965 [Thermoanaerobacteraceae bacterium]|nr:hypothetical protein [Thermoanaerobacteraceae bacterium]